MGLSTQEQMLVEQRVANEAKSTGAAYLLWFFVGGLGGHRFYLGRTGTAVVILLLTVIGIMTSVVGVGFVLLAITGIWLIVDAFLIPGMIQNHKEEVRQRLTQHALTHQPAAVQ